MGLPIIELSGGEVTRADPGGEALSSSPAQGTSVVADPEEQHGQVG